ncbi:unnamed protein product [Peniophora sp. CBMAI 1063]|nr:unnamed protein product [Peniophora sp. CBMAI 1063]
MAPPSSLLKFHSQSFYATDILDAYTDKLLYVVRSENAPPNSIEHEANYVLCKTTILADHKNREVARIVWGQHGRPLRVHFQRFKGDGGLSLADLCGDPNVSWERVVEGGANEARCKLPVARFDATWRGGQNRSSLRHQDGSLLAALAPNMSVTAEGGLRHGSRTEVGCDYLQLHGHPATVGLDVHLIVTFLILESARRTAFKIPFSVVQPKRPNMVRLFSGLVRPALAGRSTESDSNGSNSSDSSSASSPVPA